MDTHVHKHRNSALALWSTSKPIFQMRVHFCSKLEAYVEVCLNKNPSREIISSERSVLFYDTKLFVEDWFKSLRVCNVQKVLPRSWLQVCTELCSDLRVASPAEGHGSSRGQPGGHLTQQTIRQFLPMASEFCQ